MTQPTHPTVKFGDVVRNVNENERNPQDNGLERYVGLEHLDPESLHVKRWGLIAEGTSFIRKFSKGQVLFGKRRAYQRKAAAAEFDGICSGDILVFEPKNDRLLLELLPFIVQSDRFFDHALRTSAGSLSPRTKWRDLANYEFILPPLGEQRRIAEILWAADEAVEKYNMALEQLIRTKSKIFETEIQGDWKKVSLDQVLYDTQYGISKRSGTKKDGTVPILRIPNVVSAELDLSDLQWIKLSRDELDKYRLESGDVLVVRTNGNPSYVGRSVAITEKPSQTVFASYLIRLKPDTSRIHPQYLGALLNSRHQRRTLRHEIRSSAGNYNLNTRGIKRQKIPLPPINKQCEIVERINHFDDSVIQFKQHIEKLQAVKRGLLESLLSQTV